MCYECRCFPSSGTPDSNDQKNVLCNGALIATGLAIQRNNINLFLVIFFRTFWGFFWLLLIVNEELASVPGRLFLPTRFVLRPLHNSPSCHSSWFTLTHHTLTPKKDKNLPIIDSIHKPVKVARLAVFASSATLSSLKVATVYPLGKQSPRQAVVNFSHGHVNV